MEVLHYIKCMPVIRALIPMIAGIIAAIYCSWYGTEFLPLFFLIIVLCIFLLLFFQRKVSKFHQLWLKGLIISISFFLSGWMLVCLTPSEADLPEQLNNAYWICEVKDYPVEKKNSLKILLKLSNISGNKKIKLKNLLKSYDFLQRGNVSFLFPEIFNNKGSDQIDIDEAMTDSIEIKSVRFLNRVLKQFIIGKNLKVLSYFENDSLSSQLSPGDILLVRMQASRPTQNGNPDEFDYRAFLYKKSIYYQTFIKKDDWKIIQHKTNNLKYIHKRFRQSFINRIHQVIGKSEQSGIITALATGSKEYLDEDIISSYSGTGAMHVLAVSGLHVGLIWFVFDLLLGQLKRNPYTRFLYMLIMLIILWFYVLLTGMSASVTRAGIMLTLVVISAFLKKGNFKYQPVYLSAFIQLIINPFIVTDLAFQFSYMAVLSILFFQPRIKKLFYSKNRVVNYLYELGSVSLAAQIGTGVLSIYYFNKFPVYFLLSNYVVIPFVTIILVMIIISAFFWHFDLAFELISRAECFMTECMNLGVKLIESLPYSSIDNIYIDRFELWLFLGIFLLWQAYLIKKQFFQLIFIIVFLNIAFFYEGMRNFNSLKKSYLLLYNIPGIFAFELKCSNQHYLITSGLTENTKSQIIKSCKKFWLKTAGAEPVFIDIDVFDQSYEGLAFFKIHEKDFSVLVFHSISIVISNCRADNLFPDCVNQIHPDFVIINKQGLNKLPPFISFSNTKYIALTSEYKGNKYPKDIKGKENIFPVFYDVRFEGALVYYF